MMRWILLGLIVLGVLQVAFTQGQEATPTYTVVGEGQTIFAIHGSPGSASDFDTLAPKLNGSVYVFSMPGFGNASGRAQDYGIEAGAQQLIDLAVSKNLSNITIIGYSWGAGVATVAAYARPDLFSKLVLLAGMGIIEGEATGNYFGEQARYIVSYPFVVWYPGAFLGDIGWRKGFMRSYMDSDLRTIRGMMRELEVPTLILHGSTDSVIPPWVAQEHDALIQQSTLVWYDGGHGQIYGDTTMLAQEINGWLS